MVFDNITCFYERTYECSIVTGGGVLSISILMAAVLCLCLFLRQRKRRRSRDITGSSTGKPASNDYKIQSLHTDVTDDYAGSGTTDPLNGTSMKDFHNISLGVGHSIHDYSDAHGETSGIPMVPMNLPAGRGSQNANNSARLKGHSYDDVQPSETSNSVDTSSSADKGAPYSVAMAHTLVLSNVDTRGQGRKGHTYHLLDGSNPKEKATVVAVESASNSTSLSKGNSLRRNLGSSSENHQSRRTTLSSIPSKPGLFDDPNYANTSITLPGSARMQALNGNDGKQENTADAIAPTRSRSLIHNSDERNFRKPSQPQQNSAVEIKKPHNGPARCPAVQHLSVMFDDPMYDVGLNLTNS